MWIKIYLGRIVEPSKALERLFDKDDDNCNINDYDGPQECHCGNGRKISTFSSPDFDIFKRDRLYDLACTPIDGYDDVHSGHSWYVHYLAKNLPDQT